MNEPLNGPSTKAAPTDSERRSAPAVQRNRDAILSVLSEVLADCKSVLEIGSGTGEHAIYFAPRMPWLSWQTSDRAANHPGIHAWLAECPADNLLSPLTIDVGVPPVLDVSYDAVFSANTAHIMSEAEVELMFRLVGQRLEANGLFCLYGPFNIDGAFTSESNQRFDASLRTQDAKMGIRDLATLDGFAGAEELRRAAFFAMPANNFLVVWQRVDPTEQ